MRLLKLLFCLASFLLFTVVVCDRLLWFATLEQPGSTDSYYYLQDFKHFLLHAKGYYSTTSPFLLVSGTLGYLLSLNELQLLFGVAIVSLGLLSLALCIPALRKGDSYLLPALASLPWVSDIVFYRAYAFARQSLALSLLVFALSLYYTRTNSRQTLIPSRADFVSILLGLLAASMHALAAAMLAFSLLFLPMLKLRQRGFALLAAAVALSAYAHQTQKRLFTFQGLSPRRFFDGACVDFHCSSFELAEYRVLTVGLIFLVLLAWFLRTPKHPFWYFSLITAVLFNLPIWHESSGLSWRLSLASAWPLLCGWSISPYLFQKKLPVQIVSGLCFASYLLFAATLPHNRYRLVSPTIELLQRYSAKLQSVLPKDSFVLAPHGPQFAVTYYTQRASAKKIPQSRNYQHVYRLEEDGNAPVACDQIAVAQTNSPCITLNEKIYLAELE